MRSMTGRRRIAFFTERPGSLLTALEERGIRCVALSLNDCSFDVGGATHGLCLPGFGADLPAAAVVRFIAAGSFEEVTLRLGILHALEACGVPVCNAARAIERCVDKSATSFHLARCGIATPRTWVCDRHEAAVAVAKVEAGRERPLVLKPLFGAQGRGLRMIEGPGDLPPPDAVAGVYYLQRFVRCARTVDGVGWHDRRYLVSHGSVIAAMVRHGSSWITNIRQGARAETLGRDGRPAEIAVAAAAAVGAALAGVDLIEDEDGNWLVLEVNSMPSWAGLQQVNPMDIAGIVADGIVAAAGLAA